MQAKRIDDGNRTDIQRKYIDHILGSLDFLEIKDKLRDYLEIEKDRESNRSLEAEITHEAPDILVDNWEDFDEPALLTKEEPHHA
jgi:hypothetical protein